VNAAIKLLVTETAADWTGCSTTNFHAVSYALSIFTLINVTLKLNGSVVSKVHALKAETLELKYY
jgi:hypothetical protein